MKQLAIIDTEELDKLHQKIDELKQITLSNTSAAKPQKKEWVTLLEFFEMFGVKKNSWYRHYKLKIKFRDDGVYIWVHVPSMEKYLMEKAVN